LISDFPAFTTVRNKCFLVTQSVIFHSNLR
jgi:hypothetical protein